MIHPGHPAKHIWDIVIGLLLIYTALVAPVRIAFEDDTPLAWFVIDLIVDTVFLIDILLTFFTGY